MNFILKQDFLIAEKHQIKLEVMPQFDTKHDCDMGVNVAFGCNKHEVLRAETKIPSPIVLYHHQKMRDSRQTRFLYIPAQAFKDTWL